MDEFNDVQQEQHFDFGEKKNTTRKTIKRTLLAIGLALAVYMVYSIVHLFLSPDSAGLFSPGRRRIYHSIVRSGQGLGKVQWK